MSPPRLDPDAAASQDSLPWARLAAITLYFVLALVGAGLGSVFLGVLLFLSSGSLVAACSASLALFGLAAWRVGVGACDALRQGAQPADRDNSASAATPFLPLT